MPGTFELWCSNKDKAIILRSRIIEELRSC